VPRWTWFFLPRPVDSGGNHVELLRGGDALFPAMSAAIGAARREIWLATYIFHTDACGLSLVSALCEAARRGVAVHVVVDGFGSLHSAEMLRRLFEPAGVKMVVFRPLTRLAHWFNPGQLRRQHMKLCSVDGRTGFVGGINIIDDHVDLRHGLSEAPRLDYAARVRGRAALAILQAARAVWARAALGRQWRREVTRLLQTAANATRGRAAAQASARAGANRAAALLAPGALAPTPLPDPIGATAAAGVDASMANAGRAATGRRASVSEQVDRAGMGSPRRTSRLAWLRQQVRLLQGVLGGRPRTQRSAAGRGGAHASRQDRPMRARFVVRDNLRQRRSIEHAYVDALRGARERILLVCPYFYPGGEFRRALCDAARRGVTVHLLLQGKLDYRLAGMAARALYDELLRAGVHIHEYTPAFLHAKVAVVDESWATVGSSNIDPLSLLLNLEANLVVRDAAFCARLATEIERDLTQARHIDRPEDLHQGWRGWAGLATRALVAWVAHVYLKLAGVTGRY
jgi:cardiolipin synthase